ncbi:MAG TPA: energy transducer TonB [Gemmatimonadaceae bacterium]|nr:energy transducer TonB [Gemmatimonadaceae bacterium]
MVHAFVSSQVARFGAARFGVASFSVITHASLITFAVVASGPRPTSLPDARTMPVEELRFVRMPELVHRVSTGTKGAVVHAVKRAVRLLVPDMSQLQAVTDASLVALSKLPPVPTETDLSSRITSQSDFGDVDTGALVNASAMWALTHPGKHGAYTQDVVERVAWPHRDNPRPRYPSDLQRAGIEGSLVVQFVVDSTGRVDEKTLTFPSDAQPGFLRAVHDALLRSRFFPAELAGIRVRQLVQQQFTFVIAR